MPKKLCLVLGNGFTIDLLSHLNLRSDIDVVNLFRYGAEVPWPQDNKPGFLSFKHCPNLWNLGARPHMTDVDSVALIEDILACANAYASKKPTAGRTFGHHNDIYINAYLELLSYLKYLFVYYDRNVQKHLHKARNWPWLQFVRNSQINSDYDKIDIITFNYDPWLERLLLQCHIPFNMVPFELPIEKISIVKPHGSISFLHTDKMPKSHFQFNYSKTLNDSSPINHFAVSYNNLDEHNLITPLIPPAGEARRFGSTWFAELKKQTEIIAKNLNSNDDLIICGLSYWHVDRTELDDILNLSSSEVNVRMFNSNPSRTLIAVITSIFKNFITHTSTSVLKDIK